LGQKLVNGEPEKHKTSERRCYNRKKRKVTRRASLFVLVTAQPSTTPLATSPTVKVGGRPAQAHTRRPRLHRGFMCGQGPVIKRDCRARAPGSAPDHVACPHPCCPPRCTRCAAHTPARVPRRTHPPAPRARTGRPHPPALVHTARAPRQPAPARPLQRAPISRWLFAIGAQSLAKIWSCQHKKIAADLEIGQHIRGSQGPVDPWIRGSVETSVDPWLQFFDSGKCSALPLHLHLRPLRRSIKLE